MVASNKRRTEALFEENALLKQQLESSRSPPGRIDETYDQGHISAAKTVAEDTATIDLHSSQSIQNIDPTARPQSLSFSHNEIPALFTPLSPDQQPTQVQQLPNASNDPTQPRVLAGIRVEADEVDELFKLHVHVTQRPRD
ncbi:hypothetical protein LTR84_004441 [Exophiala bonariae]|uniref:BZIP domain-containing protein n=1 Tax=Exophiala bonariae TaxID=1690606 RepID=A0AAV9N868_9EURO|nr:hypothetical protein LTR84_004441 [Exophiala bonariae]